MDIVHNEVEGLHALSSEIISTAAKIHPSGMTPQLGCFNDEPIDPVHWPSSIRFEASFPLTFVDGTEWVINFPLFSRTHRDLIPAKLGSEVATLHWAKTHTTLPIPSIRACDYYGTQPWNATRRPCIILDHMPGKHITNNDWERMTLEQRLLVVAHVARIKAELCMHSFTQIGSLFYHKTRRYKVERLVSEAVNRYCHLHGQKHMDIFKAPKSPYPTAMEYLIDMANMRLIHEAIQSTAINDQYVEMWIYRSLIPSLILDEFNCGPFVLGHGYLDRTAVLFGDNFELTGIINWEWSMTEPLQVAAILPPFITGLPIDFDPESELWQQIHGHYVNALKTYEQHFRKVQPTKTEVPPVISNLVRHAVILQHAGFVASGSDGDMTAELWKHLFEPTFGQIDHALFMNIYRNAPGLLEEFKRTRLFLQPREVNSYELYPATDI